MLKNILLACAVVALCGGCEDNKNDGGNNNPDLSTPTSNPDGGPITENPDMAPTCFDNPTTNDEFLNSCTTAAIDKVDIVPFWPSKAPNGVLPDPISP